MVSLGTQGELSERFKELVLKTSDTERYREFESHTLRQEKPLLSMTKEVFPLIKPKGITSLGAAKLHLSYRTSDILLKTTSIYDIV